MKLIALLVIALIVSPCLSFADQVEIPFPIYVGDFVKDAMEHGLDLSDSRTADGFIKNEGQKFIVCTYRPVTKQELKLIQELTWRNLRNADGKIKDKTKL